MSLTKEGLFEVCKGSGYRPVQLGLEMKYCYDEYEKDCQRVKELGLRARNELHGYSFENLWMRPFLECALEKLSFTKAHPLTLDYGISG